MQGCVFDDAQVLYYDHLTVTIHKKKLHFGNE